MDQSSHKRNKVLKKWFLGFVTTTRISHATPAALYAHSSDRNFECNKKNSDGKLLPGDITSQFVNSDPGRKVKVAMGGGRSSFLPKTETDETSKYAKLYFFQLSL